MLRRVLAFWLALAARNPTDPYAWVMANRRHRGGPLLHLPFLADIARDRSPFVVIQKAAQVGVSELIVGVVLYASAVRFAGRGNVLVLHPTGPLMDAFTQTRIDPAIQDSPAIRRLLQPEPPRRRNPDSLRAKRIGDGFVALRGAESRRSIVSFDADWVFLDEADQMEEDVYELARRRLASSADGRLWAVSTPRFPEAGINALFRRSDQLRYELPCEACGLRQQPTFEANIDLERGLRVCRGCRIELDVFAQGRWLPDAPGNEGIRGYHVPRILSPWLNVPTLIEASEATSPAAIQEFFNSDLGEVYAPAGGSLSADDLDRCRRDYLGEDYAGQVCDMGVDVGGKVLHVIIREHALRTTKWGRGAQRAWFAGETTWEHIDGLLQLYNVRQCVVDATPEMSKARDFARRHPSKVSLASYGREEPGFNYQRSKQGQPSTVRANRTEMLDTVMYRFREGLSELPRDARRLGGRFRNREGYGEYYRELLEPTRVLDSDAYGGPVFRWRNSKADHYAHAEGYCWLASETGANGAFLGVRKIPSAGPSVSSGVGLLQRQLGRSS